MCNRTTHILVYCTLAFFLIGYLPVFHFLGTKWAQSFDYTYGFFVLPIICFMVWHKRNLLCEKSERNLLGFMVFLLASLLYLASIKLKIYTFASVFMVASVASAFVYLAGWSILSHMFMPLTLMLLLIPIPDQIYGVLTVPLQLKVSQASELLADWMNIPLLREGNILTTPGKVFEVAEACSGIRSLMALCSLSLLLGYFTLQNNFSMLLLFATSVPIALIVNILRVLTMIVAFHFFGFDLTGGMKHDLTNSAVFCIALVLLYLTQKLLGSWEKP